MSKPNIFNWVLKSYKFGVFLLNQLEKPVKSIFYIGNIILRAKIGRIILTKSIKVDLQLEKGQLGSTILQFSEN